MVIKLWSSNQFVKDFILEALFQFFDVPIPVFFLLGLSSSAFAEKGCKEFMLLKSPEEVNVFKFEMRHEAVEVVVKELEKVFDDVC